MRVLLAATWCLAATAAFAQAAASRQPDPLGNPTAPEQPVRFEENRGQADPRVRYISRARDYTVALTADETLLMVRKPNSSRRAQLRSSDLSLVRMRLAGASPTARITAKDRLAGKVYFAGSGARGPLTPIDTFARIEYANVYPGIDLVYYGNDHQLEFDFVVAPSADPDPIALTLDGAEALAITRTGDLAMRVGGAEVRLQRPLVYQERGGERTEIAASYVLPADEARTIRFRLGHYDGSLPLVIDPAWMTVFGSTGEDRLSGFAVDSAGHPRVLGTTFDPATFPFSQVESGVLTAPLCFLTKLDPAGLPTYTILFENTQNCGTLALSPANVAYFTGFVFPNALQNNQGTTVTVVDDSSGVPVVRRFGVANYDSTAAGDGVDALAVNSLGHVFLLGPCRSVGPGDPPLQLSGYNETPDPADGNFSDGCSWPGSGLAERTQPLLTVVDNDGLFLYGSFLSPGEPAGKYGLTVDDSDRAYIVGAFSPSLLPTSDAYRSVCQAVARPAPLCAYLMVLDTTDFGPNSLAYASYLWNAEDAETVVVRRGPSGEVYVASEGRVFDDFPSNRPTNPAAWPYSLFPARMEGIQLARFNLDAAGVPSQFDFAMSFDPSRGVAALAGQTVRDVLSDLRLFPSGAPAVVTIADTQAVPPLGVVTAFDRAGDRVGEVWTHHLGTMTPLAFKAATGSFGNLFTAGQIDRAGAQDSDIFVEAVDAQDPNANRPPTLRILEALSTHGGPLTIYADSPTAGALLQLNALAEDPEGDTLTYKWNGTFTDSPPTTNSFISARVALGMQQAVTVTVDDGHGNVVSLTQVFHVVGTPFVGTTATPVDSTVNGLVFNYAPVTITAEAIGGDGGNAYLKTRLDQIPPIPATLQAGSPPIYFDLSSDAVLVGPFTLCIDMRGMSLADSAGARLYHYQQAGQPGTWLDITSAGYPQGLQLCGQNSTLGTFAIFYPQVPATAVQTIAGNAVRANSLDGPGGDPTDDYRDGPATATPLSYLFAGAFDRAKNHVFVSTFEHILRLNLNDSTISRVAGNEAFLEGIIDGPGGDPRDDLIEGGDAFNTFVGQPAEMTISPSGDVVFFDRSSCRIRRLDVAQGQLFAVAGNGTCGFSGDGALATNASLSYGAMAFDAAGNLFIADGSHARIRRIDAATNLIDTVAGDGTFGIPANGSPARATISMPLGIAFDAQGHLLIAGGMHLLRVNPGAADALVNGDGDEVITIVGGCNTNCMAPFNGDTLPISHPQVYLPGMGPLTVGPDGSILLADTFRVRRILPGADGIVTGSADEIITTVAGYYDFETGSQIANFNGDTFATQSRFSPLLFPFHDLHGGVVVIDTNNSRVRRFGLPPGSVSPNGADLAIAVTASPDPVSASGTLRYDVTVTNNGPAAATSVTMTYVIPANAVFASATGASSIACSAPTPGASGTVTCDFGALAGGASSAVQIDITPQASGTLSSTFTVTGLEADANVANNSSIVATAVSPAAAVINVIEIVSVADAVAVIPSTLINVHEQIGVTDSAAALPSALIAVSEQIGVSDATEARPSVMIGITEAITVTDTAQLAVSTPPVTATDVALAVVPSRTVITVGESLNYAVSVNNSGSIDATGVFFTVLPANGFVIDRTTPGLSCTVASFSGLWSCSLGTIAPGSSMQFSVIGRVTASLPGTNRFTVGSATTDPNVANNAVSLLFDARPTVSINQAANQSDPTTASPINFSVVFSEPVSGFGNGDVSFAGSAIGGTLLATVTGSGANYTVSVGGMIGVGTVMVSIPAGAAVDSGGNASAASTSTDSSVLFGVATVVAMVSPGNGGNAAVTVLKFGNSINGILFYSRGTTLLTATRFTSLVIDGQTATLQGFSTNNRHVVVQARDGGTGQADTFRLWIEGSEQTAASGSLSTGSVLVQPWAPDTRLRGWVDLHTHPMSNIAFGGKLFHGAPSVNSLMPAVQMPGDPECRFDDRATSIAEALSQDAPTRGDPLQSRCGDAVRNTLIKAVEMANGAVVAPAGADGFPAFTHWPKWSDITHQKMWVDWIRRSWEGGQRVLVALSHNNRTIAEMLGSGGPVSGVKDDRASSDLQIHEIKRLVAEHPDFMALATTPGELHSIVQGGRLAIVLGMEIDKIGNFSTTSPPSLAVMDTEIDRLHGLGVRYILPIHFVDNAIGDTAVDEPLYNILNLRENQAPLSIGCALFGDEIGFRWPGIPPVLAPFLLGGMAFPNPPACQPGGVFNGHINTRSANGLTALGDFAIRAMMRRGIIVDIDHMSNRAANRTLAIASAVPGGGYPVTSGHAGIRERANANFNAETARSTSQLARIACLGGMFGLGTDSAGAHRWAALYDRGYNVMRRAFAPNGICPGTLPLGPGFVALGTDANSLVKTPVPPMFDPVGQVRFVDIYNANHPNNAGVAPLTRSTTGTRTWDYNIDGVAHYGMFVDFLRDVRWFSQPGLMTGREMVDDQMMYGADYFYQMWLKADAQKARVP